MFSHFIKIVNAIEDDLESGEIAFTVQKFRNYYKVQDLSEIQVIIYDEDREGLHQYQKAQNGFKLQMEQGVIEDFQVLPGCLKIQVVCTYLLSFTVRNIQDSFVLTIPNELAFQGNTAGSLDVVGNLYLEYKRKGTNQIEFTSPSINDEQYTLSFRLSLKCMLESPSEVTGFSLEGYYKDQIVSRLPDGFQLTLTFIPSDCTLLALESENQQVKSESQYLEIKFQSELAFSSADLIFDGLFDAFSPSPRYHNYFECFLNDQSQDCSVYEGTSLLVQSTYYHSSQDIVSLLIQPIITPRSLKPTTLSLKIRNDKGNVIAKSQQTNFVTLNQVLQLDKFLVECIDCTVNARTNYQVCFRASQNLYSNDYLLLTLPHDLQIDSLHCSDLAPCTNNPQGLMLVFPDPIEPNSDTCFSIGTILNTGMNSGPFSMKILDKDGYQMFSTSSAVSTDFISQTFPEFNVVPSSTLLGVNSDLIVTFRNELPIKNDGYLFLDIDRRIQITGETTYLHANFNVRLQFRSDWTRFKILPQTLDVETHSFRIANILLPPFSAFDFRLVSFDQFNFIQEQAYFKMTYSPSCSTKCATCAPTYDICLTCRTGFYALGLDCLQQCPQGTVVQNNMCMACHPNCVTCDSADLGVCTGCSPGLTLKNGTCFTTNQLAPQPPIPEPPVVDPVPPPVVDPPIPPVIDPPVDPTPPTPPVDPTPPPVNPTPPPVDPTPPPVDPTPVDPTPPPPVDPPPVDPNPVDPTPVDPTPPPVDPTPPPVDPTPPPVDPTPPPPPVDPPTPPPVDPPTPPVDPTPPPVDPEPEDPIPPTPEPEDPQIPEAVDPPTPKPPASPENVTNSTSSAHTNPPAPPPPTGLSSSNEYQFRELMLTYILVPIIVLLLLRKMCYWRMNYFHALQAIFSLLDPALVILNFVSFVLNQQMMYFCFALCYSIGNLAQMMHSQMILVAIVRVDPNYQALKMTRTSFKIFNFLVLFYDWKFLLIMKSKLTSSQSFDVPFTMLLELSRKIHSLLAMRIFVFYPLVIALSLTYLCNADKETLIIFQAEYLAYNLLSWLIHVYLSKHYSSQVKCLELDKNRRFQEEILQNQQNDTIGYSNIKVPTSATNQVHPMKVDMTNDSRSIQSKLEALQRKTEGEGEGDFQKTPDKLNDFSQIKSYDN